MNENYLEGFTRLKKVDCRSGKECLFWRTAMGESYCIFPGAVVIGGKRLSCLCFKPNYEYLREDFHERLAELG